MKPHFSRKIAAKRDFREQGGGAEAEASNARQGIATNLPRAQPLKARFLPFSSDYFIFLLAYLLRRKN